MYKHTLFAQPMHRIQSFSPCHCCHATRPGTLRLRPAAHCAGCHCWRCRCGHGKSRSAAYLSAVRACIFFLDFPGRMDMPSVSSRSLPPLPQVRTELAEGMADQGLINITDIRIINLKDDPSFPFPYSTTLAAPEWPIASLRHTPSVSDASALCSEATGAMSHYPADILCDRPVRCEH